jgi:V/A-type H+-transporting ATPase subunit E
MSSELITLLEREAAAEREQVLAKAREEAAAVQSDAQRQADEMLAAHRERLETEARAALVKAQSTAQLQAASLVLRAKEQAIAAVFEAAQAQLTALVSNGQRYPAALRLFIEEAIRDFNGPAIVSVNPADQSIVQALVKERGWDVTVKPDPAVTGGARIASRDGRLVVTNTLASRLGRARPLLAAEVARLLWPQA